MRTSSRIFISLGVAAGVFGAMALWTEWGQRNFSPDADSMGIFWLVMAGCFVVLGGLVQAFSKPGGAPAEPADDEPKKEEVDDPGIPLCPSCLAPAKPLQHFCSECGSPLTSHAEIEPIGQIRSIGHMVSNAASGPPRRIVLIGMWCIFAIPVVLMIFAMVQSAPQSAAGPMVDDDGHVVWSETSPAPLTLQRILKIAFVSGILLLYVAILIKTTRNYFRKKKAADQPAPDAENIDVGA